MVKCGISPHNMKWKATSCKAMRQAEILKKSSTAQGNQTQNLSQNKVQQSFDTWSMWNTFTSHEMWNIDLVPDNN